VAETYVWGVSNCAVEKALRKFGIESLPSSQDSRFARLIDEELKAWRTRDLGTVTYLALDARYDKIRYGGVVRDAAVLTAIGVGPDEWRRVLGTSVALSDAEVHVGDIISCFGSTQPISQLISKGMIAAFIDGLMAILAMALTFVYSPILGGPTWPWSSISRSGSPSSNR